MKTNQTPPKLTAQFKNLVKDYKAFLKVYNGIKKYITIDEELVFGRKLRYVQFHAMESKMEDYQKGMPLLQKWSQLTAILFEKPSEIADPVIELIKADKIEIEDIIPCLKANFADDLLRNAFLNNQVLSNFIGEIHERKIGRFIDLDRDVISLNRREFPAELPVIDHKLTVLHHVTLNSEFFLVNLTENGDTCP